MTLTNYLVLSAILFSLGACFELLHEIVVDPDGAPRNHAVASLHPPW